MIVEVQKPSEFFPVSIELPLSKSISNRLLILKNLSSNVIDAENFSDAEDTKILQRALNTKDEVINAGDAGTAARFLLAFLSVSTGEKILTASQRMKQRPVAELVSALKSIGADITYLDQHGFYL